VFRLREDGGLAAPHASVAHQGSGPVVERQAAPHPHCVLASPDDRFVLVTDLGTDSVIAYRYDAASGALGAAQAFRMPPGSGPRHMAFHPQGDRLYVINELSSTIAALAYDATSGGMRLLDTVSALPDGFAGENHCADLQVSADGRFLYGSNRGHDSIVAVAIEGDRLRVLGHVASGGRTPRSFALDASGRFLLVANQNGDSLVVFRIDPASGLPQPGGEVAAIGTPMCVRLARVEGWDA
jgi:6-phosphogluconolactonase